MALPPRRLRHNPERSQPSRGRVMAASGTRQRMIDSAVRMLRERGVHGLTVDAVLLDSGAPRGSVYHHFPGGRQEILVAAAHASGSYITRMFEAAVAGADPMAAVETFAEFWRRVLVDSDYRSGCPVASLTVDGGSEELVEVAQDAFAA